MQSLVQVYRYSQDHTFTRQKHLYVNIYNYTRDHTLTYRYILGCAYSGANTFTHKPQSNTITAALSSMFEGRNSHIIALVLSS